VRRQGARRPHRAGTGDRAGAARPAVAAWSNDTPSGHPARGRRLLRARARGADAPARRAGQGALRQPAGRLRAPRRARRRPARGPRAHRQAPPGTGRPGAGERHGQRGQPGRARAVRGGADDRAERARRRGAAGRGLDHRSLRRRDPGRLDVRPGRGGLEERLCDLCLRPARAEVARRAARRRGRAAPDLRRGSGRGDRAEVAARAGPDQAGPCDQRRLLLRHRDRAQRLPAPRGPDHRQVGPRRPSRDRPRRARSGHPRARGALRASQGAWATSVRRSRASPARPWSLA
jgi:hypothetical protein